jgi:DNA-binding protein Fis
VSKAARVLGMQRSSLRYRIERFGLEDFVKELAGK